MAIDREATLKNAEKFLRIGRLDAAIAEYARLVEDQPKDWNTANALGDLYMRAGQSDKAVPLYSRVAGHLLAEGFYPKAAALFKKILKITPDDEAAQLRLAEIAARQGLMADARAYYAAVERQRRQAGDAAGADEIVVRLGDLDPDDLDARLSAARAAARGGQAAEAAAQYGQLYDDLLDAGREEEAASCVERAAEGFAAAGDFARAAALLRQFAVRVPGRVPTLLKLVEVCVDGNLEEMMFDAQAQLAEAYLASGSGAEARVIAEDLVARAPGDPAAVDRLRRALAALDVAHAGDAVAEYTSITVEPDESAPGSAVPDEEILLDLEPAALPEAVPAPQAPAAPAEPGRPAAVEIDLTGLLGGLEGQVPAPEPPARPVRDLEDVFAGLRADVERDEAEDASGDHFDLARTYLDMGMPQEAIGALEMAARSPRYRFAAACLLAEVHRDEGDVRAAIEWCERAAEVPAPQPEQGRSLLYDLGDLLEAVGETARALAVFLELAADAPDYRDVRARVTRLSRIETEG